jgi:hypothetical protein
MHKPTSSHLAAVTSWFEDNFRERGELGASVSIWQNGAEILALSSGPRAGVVRHERSRCGLCADGFG